MKLIPGKLYNHIDGNIGNLLGNVAGPQISLLREHLQKELPLLFISGPTICKPEFVLVNRKFKPVEYKFIIGSVMIYFIFFSNVNGSLQNWFKEVNFI